MTQDTRAPWGVSYQQRGAPCRWAILTQLLQPCGEKEPWLLALPGKGRAVLQLPLLALC